MLENLSIPGLLERHAKLRASVQWAQDCGVGIRRLMPFSDAAFFRYLFNRADPVKCAAFWFELVMQQAKQPSSAVRLLRQRLEGNPKPSPGARLRLIVKAWNAFLNGQPLAELQLTPREGVQPIAGVKEAA